MTAWFQRSSTYRSTRLRMLAAMLLAAASGVLAGCGGHEAPQTARIVPPQPATADLGDGYRAHYNLLPTLALSPAVADEYAIRRSTGTGLLLVALRHDDGSGELPAAAGTVAAQVRDLSGRVQSVELRGVRTGDYIDHVGAVAISQHDTLRVEVTLTIDGSPRRFRFERAF